MFGIRGGSVLRGCGHLLVFGFDLFDIFGVDLLFGGDRLVDLLLFKTPFGFNLLEDLDRLGTWTKLRLF